MPVLTMPQALTHLTRSAIRHRVASGRWQEPFQSVFVTHSGQISPGEHRWIAVLATGGVLAGLSAVDLRGYADEAIHVLLPSNRRPRQVPSGVTIHRTALLEEGDVVSVSGPPRTKPARSVVDAAQWARTDDQARAIVAAAYQQRLVADRDVQDALRRLRRARRRALIMQTAADAAGGAHSLAEIDFVELCRAYDLPEPARQVVRRDSSGRRRYLDALFEEWQVHVEVDGSQHFDPRSAWSDMRRQNELWIAGERVLRFPAWALRRDPAGVMHQVRAALTAAGWTPH